MKALSVRQPFADQIRRGVKPLEIRSKPTHYRGPLLICASKFFRARDNAALPRGVAICTVTVTGCRPFTAADAGKACTAWRPGLFAWELADVHEVASFPVSGSLGFFEVADDKICIPENGKSLSHAS